MLLPSLASRQPIYQDHNSQRLRFSSEEPVRGEVGSARFSTALLNLLNLGLETGSLFGPLYLSRALAIYLAAQSAVCNITGRYCGDGDV